LPELSPEPVTRLANWVLHHSWDTSRSWDTGKGFDLSMQLYWKGENHSRLDSLKVLSGRHSASSSMGHSDRWTVSSGAHFSSH
jgi:hypothetical protein